MDVGIDIKYDKTAETWLPMQSGILGYWQGLSVETSYGKRIEMRGVSKGIYYLHISPADRPMIYDLTLELTSGSMPADGYERMIPPRLAHCSSTVAISR